MLSYEKFKSIKLDKQLPAQLRYPYGIDTMQWLNENDYPEYASLIVEFKNWNRRGDTDNKGAAIFLLTYQYLSKSLNGQPSRQITQAEALATYGYIKNYMVTHFGRTDITLGDLQKLVRGDRDWPLWGFPDLLSPQWTAPYKDGKLKSIGGDGLIMFIRFPKQGLPLIETVNMYGASARPGNKHFDDQVELYLQQKTKRMTLDKGEVYRVAEKIYNPK
jgi:acyl-homoserine-lactone acylase